MRSSGKRGRARRILLALSVLSLLASPVLAKDHNKKHKSDDSPPGLRQPGPSGPGISLDRAIEIAERQYRARVVRGDATEINGRRVYVLRLLSEEGRVWTVRVDAQSGGVM
jgi:uncharacterized membrane protein YkoI